MAPERLGAADPPTSPPESESPPAASTTAVPLTEERLVSGLQPVRQFVLAQVLLHTMQMGILDAIARPGGMDVRTLAHQLDLHEPRIRGLIQYLANEGIVEQERNHLRLSGRGRDLLDLKPWYTLLVGGYSHTFAQLPKVLRAGLSYAERDSVQVGVGSCGISRHDALPMTRRLIEHAAQRPRTVVDLGCGDGTFLMDICGSTPDLYGLGIDPDERSVAAAIRAARRQGLSDRLSARTGTATDIFDLSALPRPYCFITAFVLQEVLEQSGRNAVVHMLRSTFDTYPESLWIVVEVDHRPADPAVMSHGLGLAYYNPYYLIHQITEQRLEPSSYWEAIYREAGLHVLAVEHPDPRYDSLRLKMGYLLGRPGQRNTDRNGDPAKAGPPDA
jgi:2-ketoarginine methyltransferase